ncbi:G patch domain-containing protein 2-like isoform X2 [Pungitius pungitius]|uniref:G patch domain-containing protein 2-like isoform X2 n=1 Tax=Pungitius pungitius TaxID=134920 RepID=UPI002E1637BC
MMDELVQDLVSALEQTSEKNQLGDLWEEMVLSPLHRRRQTRRRRGRRRCRESSLYPLQHRRCWIEASESSLDETKGYREKTSSTMAAAVANSDSDDVTSANRWRSVARGPVRTRQPSWPESDSFTESNAGRQLRRRRKVKRMSSDIAARLQQKLKVSGVDRKRRHRPPRMQRLSVPKNRSAGLAGAERPTEGARMTGKERWKRKMVKDHRDAADENMSEGETSSTCSSDPGLFTNDEGRQGYPCRSPRGPGSAACCVRKDRRRLPSKGGGVPVFVERLRHFSQDPYQRDLWLPSVGKRDRCQLSPLCPLPVCPLDMMSESSHLRCSTSNCRNRQTNVSFAYQSCSDIRRRRTTEAVSVTTSASGTFHKDHRRTEARGGSNASTLEAVAPSAPGSLSLSFLRRDHEEPE